jgi:hypothetical protein
MEPNCYLELNHGRWIVNCWNCPMAYAEVRGIPEMCGNCGAQLEVVYPNPTFRSNVEEVVASRPEENRNWTPGETLDMLIAENIAHGVDNP